MVLSCINLWALPPHTVLKVDARKPLIQYNHYGKKKFIVYAIRSCDRLTSLEVGSWGYDLRNSAFISPLPSDLPSCPCTSAKQPPSAGCRAQTWVGTIGHSWKETPVSSAGWHREQEWCASPTGNATEWRLVFCKQVEGRGKSMLAKWKRTKSIEEKKNYFQVPTNRRGD